MRDLRTLSVWWPLPPLRPLYRSKPHCLLSHLLGHEAEGSLLSLLKTRGWADSLCAGETNSNSDFSLFEVQMDLSPEGDKHVDEILQYVFQYLTMLRSSPPPRWVFDECVACRRWRSPWHLPGISLASPWHPPSNTLAPACTPTPHRPPLKATPTFQVRGHWRDGLPLQRRRRAARRRLRSLPGSPALPAARGALGRLPL